MFGIHESVSGRGTRRRNSRPWAVDELGMDLVREPLQIQSAVHPEQSLI